MNVHVSVRRGAAAGLAVLTLAGVVSLPGPSRESPTNPTLARPPHAPREAAMAPDHPARPARRAVKRATPRPAVVAPVRPDEVEQAARISTQVEDARAGTRLARNNPGAALEYALRKRVPPGEDNIPTQKYLEAYEQMRMSPRFSTAEARMLPALADAEAAGRDESAASTVGTWTPLGPGNIGGRTRVLLIDPGNPSVMYAAGVAGGVWKTTNGGGSWTPKADMLANIAVSSMAMDPNNSSVLYAGTGEGFSNVDAVRGAGIFKSTDGGDNWTQLSATATSTSFQYIFDIVVSKVNSNNVYAATKDGVWRSLDGGTTWTHPVPPFASDGCTDLAMRTDQLTDYIFATCHIFNSAGRVYRNTDAAGSGAWNIVLGGVNIPDIDGPIGRTSLAIAPSNQNIIYALSMRTSSGTYQRGLHAVFRSTSSGDAGTWTPQVRNTDATKLNTVQLSNPRIAFYQECGFGTTSAFLNQGWYDNVIAVDPVDPNRVWTGGIDLMRSDDSGVNWGLASYWWNQPPSAHADQHAIVFHPQYNGTSNKTMFVGNDGGIYRTDDARAAVATGAQAACSASNTSVAWTELNNNLGITQFYHGLPYPDGTTYFGGTQDNGTLRSSDAAGAESWTEIHGGDGGYVAIDPGNTNILYGANPVGGIVKSTDGGSSFAAAETGLSDSGFQFITPFVMDPSNAQRLWTAGIYIWRTDNGATSWTRASAITRGLGTATALAVKPGDPNTVLVGMSDGFINRNTAALAATNTTNWDFTQPRSGANISSLTYDPSNPQTVYATVSTFGGSHIYKSTDGGQSWSQGLDATRLTGLPDIPVHSLVVDPNNSRRLYIGTDAGVFVSLDGGATWIVENSGFANVITEALAVTSVGGTPNLFAFTHGRGAWRVPLQPLSSAPLLTLMNPNRVIAGGPDLVVTVFGANFANNSVVRWNGGDRATTFVSSTRLTATLSAADVGGAGSGSVTVFNPTSGLASDPLTFTLDSGTNPSPFLLSMSPTNGREGGGDMVLTVTVSFGTPANSSMRVRWNGQDRPTWPVNPPGVSANTTLMALIPASDVAAAGTYSVTVFAPGPGGGTSSAQTFTLGTPKISMSPTSLNFGNVPTGTTTSSQTVTISNPGTGNLNFTNLSSSSCCNGAFTRTGTCSISTPVPGGGSCTVVYTYTSNTVGSSTGTLNISSNAFNINSPITLSFAAAGVGPGVNVSQSSLSFGDQAINTSSNATTVVLNNGSANAITVNSIVSSSNQFPMNHNCPLSPNTLAAAASCNINVSFAPTSTGSKSGTVTVTDTGSGSPRTINLSGNGTAIVATLNPASLDLGAHVPGRNTLPKSFTLTNNGNLNLTVSNIGVSGNYSMSHDCPGSLAPSATCTVTVMFLNTVPLGPANGAVTITSNAAGSPHTVNLTASVVDFTLSISRSKRPPRTGIPAGQAKTFDVILTPSPEMDGPITLGCADAPLAVSCSVTPGLVRLQGREVAVQVRVAVAPRSRRLQTAWRSTPHVLKVHATYQGVTRTIELPVIVER